MVRVPRAHEGAQATTSRVSMRGKGAHARTMRSHKHKRAPRLAGVPTLSLCPGRRQRRDPEGSRLSLRMVAAPSALTSRPSSNTFCPSSTLAPNQLKYRLSRTRKPKSHATSNTKCPFTRRRRPGRARPSAAPKNDYWAVMSSFVATRSLICPRGAPNWMDRAPADPINPQSTRAAATKPTGTNKPGTHFPAITGENRPPGQCQPHNGPTRVN